MASFKRKGTVHNGFSTLVKAIEELSGTRIDLNDNKELIDINKLRKEEARAASIEISRMKLENHKKFVKSVYEEHRIDSRYTFDSIRIDDLNTQAVATAKGFCATGNYNFGEDSAPILLLIQGAAGSGKTVLSNCVANNFLNVLWKDVVLTSYTEMKKNKTPSSGDTSFDRSDKDAKWERFISVDLLIIDGLCQNREALTAFDRTVIPDLLRARRARDLPLVITTPLLPSEMHMHLGDEIFESIKEYSVLATSLFGQSRREPISFGGANFQ